MIQLLPSWVYMEKSVRLQVGHRRPSSIPHDRPGYSRLLPRRTSIGENGGRWRFSDINNSCCGHGVWTIWLDWLSCPHVCSHSTTWSVPILHPPSSASDKHGRTRGVWNYSPPPIFWMVPFLKNFQDFHLPSRGATAERMTRNRGVPC